MLPILTLDEARLSPSHGYIFNRCWLCPHETILGIAWKLARMNALPGPIAAKQLAWAASKITTALCWNRADAESDKFYNFTRTTLAVHGRQQVGRNELLTIATARHRSAN